MSLVARLVLAAGILALAACAAPPASPAGLMDVTERPAEKALLAGMRAYEDAQYAEAEKQLQASLQAGLASPRDRAAANKHLAFIFCTSQRMADCEKAFSAARRADPQFALGKSEAGHPVWGPVYKRALP
jgi:hypothetical protein